MCSMDVLMGDLEEGRQQRSEVMTVNGCEVGTKCEWQQEGGVLFGGGSGCLVEALRSGRMCHGMVGVAFLFRKVA